MIKRVIVGSLVALALVGAGIAIGASTNGDWGRGHDAVVVTGGASGAMDAGQTIVVSDGHWGPGFFFFPFGLLFFFLFFFLIVSFFQGGRRGGHWRSGSGPAWLEEWHRRAHEPSNTHETEGPTSG
jgi:hypothetical protein